MKHGIKFIAASLALTLALGSLCSCGSSTSSKGSVSDASSSASSAKPTETTTEAPSTPDVLSDGEYVYTAKEFYCPFTGSFGITGETDINGDKIRNRIPLLKLESEDAQKINAEIKSDFSAELSSKTIDGTETRTRTDYISPVNDNILSLVIESRTMDTPQSGFWIYNIDITNGNRADKSELFEKVNTTEDEAREKIRADIEKKFLDVPGDYASMNYTEEAKEASLSDENLELTEYYLDENGNLIACYILHWIAGAEIYCVLLNLSE